MVYGQVIKPELVALARANGVSVVKAMPEGVQAVPDDMGGIIDAARKIAEDAKTGLEPRLDLSSMRPEGAPIKGSGGTSSGPVSFLLEIFDNFLEWANRGAEQSGPINTLRFVYAPSCASCVRAAPGAARAWPRSASSIRTCWTS